MIESCWPNRRQWGPETGKNTHSSTSQVLDHEVHQSSLWGSGGWGCVRPTLLLRSRNRSQPSATFRNHPQPFATVRAILLYGRAYDKFCRRGAFWRFQTSRCFLSRGGHGTSWHSDVFCNVSKAVLCGKSAILFCDVFTRCVAVFVAGAALWACLSSFCVVGATLWTCRVACFLEIALAGLHQVVTRRRFRGRRGIFWDVLKIDGSLAQNIDFEIVKFRVREKILGKRWFWCYKVSILEEVLHEMLVLVLPRVSSGVSGFPVASLCLWGKLQNLFFSKVATQVVMLFCVAGVALCNIPTCFYTMSKVSLVF